MTRSTLTENRPDPMAPITRHFMRALVRNPRGRAFLLSQLADAEIADEGMVFDRLLSTVDDPVLTKLVRKHGGDEQRHYAMLVEAVAREGFALVPMPPELRIVGRLDALLGGLSEQFLSGAVGVTHACALLYVLEERAVREFPLIVSCLREVAPDAAGVLESVLADERRHVRYALAVGRKYETEPGEMDALVRRVRAAEERAFLEHRTAMARYALSRDLLTMPWLPRLLWRGFTWLSERTLRSTSAAARPPAAPLQRTSSA